MIEFSKRHRAEKFLITSAILQATCASFSLATTYYCYEDDPKVIAQVSDFYGPGAFYAWLITALSTLVLTDYASGSAPSSDSDSANNPDAGGMSSGERRTSSSSYDAGLLATVAYPLIASVDVLRCVATNENVPQMRAALAVTQVAQLVCCLGIAAAHCRIEMRIRRTRASIWAIAAFTSALATVPAVLKEYYRVPRQWLPLFFVIFAGWQLPATAIWMAILTFSNALRTAPADATDPLKWFDGTVYSGLVSALLPVLYPTSDKKTEACVRRLDWDIPRSGSSIRDLDQAAALGVAIACSGIVPAALTVKNHVQSKVSESPYNSFVGYLTNEIRNAFRRLA